MIDRWKKWIIIHAPLRHSMRLIVFSNSFFGGAWEEEGGGGVLDILALHVFV